MNLNQLSELLIYSLIVIIIITFGAYGTENFKSVIALLLDFSSQYNPSIWVQSFSPKTEVTESAYQLSYSIIDFSGKLFTWIISFIGFKIGSKASSETIKFFGFALSLFFMRDVCIALIESTSGVAYCTNNGIWKVLNINHNIASWIYAIIGVSIFCYLIYLVKDRRRLIYILSGFIGTIIGLYAWIKFAPIIL